MGPLPPLRIKLRSSRHAIGEACSSDDATQSRKENVHWRTHMQKMRPEKYAEYKVREKLYKHHRAATLTEAQKEREKELTRERVRRFRMKKRAEDEEKKKQRKSKSKSKSEADKKKKQQGEWRLQKQKQREAWTEKQRKEYNMKQRAKRLRQKEELEEFRRKILEEERMKREEEKRKLEQQQLKERREEERREEERRKCVARSKVAKRKYLSRARNKLSPDATIFADTLRDLITYSTPRKRQALNQRGIIVNRTDTESIITETVATELKKNRQKRDKKTRLVRRALAIPLQPLGKQKKQHLAKKTFGATPKLLKNLNTQDRYKNPFSIPKNVKKLVTSFYEKEAIQLPNKKNVSRKTLQATAVLQRPIASLFQEFKQAHPDVEMKKSSFFMLRPKNIKPMGLNKLRGCLCEWCRNIHLKVSTINALCVKFSSSSSCRIRDEFFASKLTLCPKLDDQKHHKLSCIQRQCPDCGVKLLQDHLKSLLDEAGADYLTEWSRWGLEKTGTINKMVLSGKSGPLSDLVSELCEEMNSYSAHLFQWFWQHEQYTYLSNDPPANTLVAVLDFAENYSNLIQDEVQAAHWGHQQTTIHPIVCTYRCKCHNERVSHSVVYISDDKKHDYHSVHHFSEHCVNHLRNAHRVDIDKVVRFSDGCAAQYKSRGAFLDISQSDLPTEHHFFGARHGKGPSDGESAVVKQKASTAVRSSQAVLPTAYSLYTFCKEELTRTKEGRGSNEESCMSFKREFFYIPSSDINHERPVPVKAVKDTRKIACVKNGGGPLELFHRTLSCFCIPCMTNKGECANKEYVGKWTSTLLKLPDDTPVDASLQTSSTTDTSHSASASTTSLESTADEPAGDTTEEMKSSRPSIHDFVTVRVPVQHGRKNRVESSGTLFIAQVASAEDGKFRLQYMKQHLGDLFSWPDGEAQFFLHPASDIENILPQPELSFIGSRPFLKFSKIQ